MGWVISMINSPCIHITSLVHQTVSVMHGLVPWANLYSITHGYNKPFVVLQVVRGGCGVKSKQMVAWGNDFLYNKNGNMRNTQQTWEEISVEAVPLAQKPWITTEIDRHGQINKCDNNVAIRKYTLTINIMTSSYGNIFRVTSPLCREFTGEFP